MPEFDNIVDLEFNDADWHLVQPFEDKTLALTAKNTSNTSVSVFCTELELEEEEISDYLVENMIDPPEIGGIFFEANSKKNERMYIRCNEGAGKISVRIFGTVDPMADITALGQILSETILRLDQHLETKAGNPHSVTKEEVGLGNLPNATTDSVDDDKWMESNDDKVLTTLKALREVYKYAKNHIDIVEGNPHRVTKAEVGLGNVENYAPATEKEALDITNNQAYMTPYSANILVKDIVVVASSMKPQMVLEGRTVNRPDGWTMNDITLPVELIGKIDDRTLQIKPGLVVSFAYRGMCRISKRLTEDITCIFPATLPNGTRYMYVDLDEKGNFTGWGSTEFAPRTHSCLDAVDGDYYNYALCEMRHANGDEIKRVYIAKVFMNGNKVTKIVSVPLGDECIVPVHATIDLGRSALIDNPFIAPVNTTALVEWEGKWGATMWNDQTGVIASPRPGYELDQISIQAGMVGYVTRGSSSGCSFGAEFETVTIPPRMAVKVTRPH